MARLGGMDGLGGEPLHESKPMGLGPCGSDRVGPCRRSSACRSCQTRTVWNPAEVKGDRRRLQIEAAHPEQAHGGAEGNGCRAA